MKTAFNKYNAPEVLATLMKALQVAGLGEIVVNLRRMKVPQIINDAWMHREKQAMILAEWGFTLKEASDIKGVLMPLMDSFRSHVKDYNQFIKLLVRWLPEWDFETLYNDVETEYLYDEFQVKSQEPNLDKVMTADVVQMAARVSVSIPKIIRALTKDLKRVVSDPKGFQRQWEEFLQGRGAQTFFHLLASQLKSGWGHKGDRWDDSVENDQWLIDLDEEAADPPLSTVDMGVSFSVNKTLGKSKVTWKVQGRNLVFHIVADVDIEVHLSPERGYVPPKEDYGLSPRWASWSMLKTSQDFFDYLGQKAKVPDRILGDLKAVAKRQTYGSGIKAIATGFIYLIWQRRNGALAKDLWNLFEGRGPSMDNSDRVQRVAAGWAGAFPGDALGAIQLAAVCIMLLKKTRQPRVAKWTETVLTKYLSKELADAQVPSMEGLMSPVQVFEARITPEIQGMVAKIYNELGKDPLKAVEFAADLAEDVNWSEGWKTVGGGAPYDPPPNVQDVTSFFRWGLEDIALVMVALLRLARQKGIALKVKRLALKSFEGSWDEV